jgi:uncharacterized protein
MIDQKDIFITMRDGVKIALRIYRPDGLGPFPTLYAASPYRYDNNDLPASALFLWRETGPIEWYVEHGYAFVHADVRGSGKSEGNYGFLNYDEQRDHYEIIEWIAAQAWSTGKVGGIGQSYYCISQWFMALQNPPHLTCIGAYDGGVDAYQCFGPRGGIESGFASTWFNQSMRVANLFPANGDTPRSIPQEISNEILLHPLLDDWWKERIALDHLHRIRVPMFSIGSWAKQDLHLEGNLIAFQRASGEKKLFVTDAPSVFATAADFESTAFHEEFLLPFYDHYLKGLETSHSQRPPVSFRVRNSKQLRESDQWPLPGLAKKTLYLGAGPTGTVHSLNDGALAEAAPAAREQSTSYRYPDPQWVLGSATLTPHGPDTVRRVLTFTSAPLAEDLELCGQPKLVLYASSSEQDTDFFVRISEQFEADDTARPGAQPRSVIVTKGCARVSQRDEPAPEEPNPYFDYSLARPLSPGQVYQFSILLNPMSYRFAKGSRLRVEIANIDSSVSESAMAHIYKPSKIGTDTIYHDEARPSRIVLPVYPQVAVPASSR